MSYPGVFSVMGVHSPPVITVGNCKFKKHRRQSQKCKCEASIRDSVNSLPDRRVDVLVNNAGVGMIGALERQSIAAMKEAMKLLDTNLFGLARLVREVLPDMNRRQSGHIVVMSSIMGIQGCLFSDVHSASKFAVEGFCQSLAVQVAKFKTKMNPVEPGSVVTKFERKVYEDAEKMALSGTDEETARIFHEVYLPYSKKIFSSLGQTQEEVAQQTVKVITAKEPPLQHQTNHLYMIMTVLKHADPTGRLQRRAGKK
uniref:retinol dehydrogenase 8-like n=1 Tax=Monopterus albus TaxID=43700 RepID=UPI0009B3E11A|nr:retinol dehydrogenase 8-like [Monopterus albus]